MCRVVWLRITIQMAGDGSQFKILLCTEYKRDAFIFHGHPNYRNSMIGCGCSSSAINLSTIISESHWLLSWSQSSFGVKCATYYPTQGRHTYEQKEMGVSLNCIGWIHPRGLCQPFGTEGTRLGI